MTVILNSILLTMMFILMHTNTLMAVYLLSQTTIRTSIKYSHSLDPHSHRLDSLIKSLENLNERTHMPVKKSRCQNQ